MISLTNKNKSNTMFFYFFEDVMRVLLVILLFLGFTVSAFAVWDSKGYVMNYSHYLLKPTSAGWHISEGHKIYENLQMIGPTKEPSDYTPVYPTYVIGVSFNNGLSEAEAIYEYFDENFIKQGECYFEFHTRDYVWEPSFRNSHCTGPISLFTYHNMGGDRPDMYTYQLR
ncbi:MAG: hypothetical protein A3I12_01075 [Gammaproteobacteria bacterium RIFCSPLOWO2_02_FULL_38_11]|nr:MAG: hypothetical protein A3B69_01385 [Gammaproteobacteria bacterium RIFCSPHIGHO2_02_FULL_38_33]OGT23796.1 MAG: hypothetical protein A2W47_07345 [Gammaproteobacteria bacterium RIFCSPHIGHO2_12_38_15]OGT68892.1 MAG: hypothetical protein A3I12_01075 [Gammaproteobacteria bacterium RIFCSPLOWO2_02_FULL_38_11]